MTPTKTPTSSPDKTGVHICEAPSCFRQLKGGQGRKTTTLSRTLRTCYTLSCAAWAERMRQIEEES